MYKNETVTPMSIVLGRNEEQRADIQDRTLGLSEALTNIRERQVKIKNCHSSGHLGLAELHKILGTVGKLKYAIRDMNDLRANMERFAKAADDTVEVACGDRVTRIISKDQFADLVRSTSGMLATTVGQLIETTDKILQQNLHCNTALIVNKINSLLRIAVQDVKTEGDLACHVSLSRITDALNDDQGILDSTRSLRAWTYAAYAQYLQTREERFREFYNTSILGDETDDDLLKNQDGLAPEINPIIQEALLAQLQTAELILSEQKSSDLGLSDDADGERKNFLRRDILGHLRGSSSILRKVQIDGLVSLLQETIPITVSMIVESGTVEDTDEAKDELNDSIMHRLRLMLGVSDLNFEIDEDDIPIAPAMNARLPNQTIDSLMRRRFFSDAPPAELVFPAPATVLIENPIKPEIVLGNQYHKTVPDVDNSTAVELTVVEALQLPADRDEVPLSIEPERVTTALDESVQVEQQPSPVKLSSRLLATMTGLPEEIFETLDNGFLTDDLILDRIGAFEATVGIDIGNQLILAHQDLLADPRLLEVTIAQAQANLDGLKAVGSYEQLGLAIVGSYADILLASPTDFATYTESLARVWNLINTNDFPIEVKSKFAPWAQPDQWSSVSDLINLRATLISIRDGKLDQQPGEEKLDNVSRDAKLIEGLVAEGWNKTQASNAVAILLYAFKGFPKLPEGALYDRSPARLRDQSFFHKTCVALKGANALVQPSTGKSEMYKINLTCDGVKSETLREVIQLYRGFKRA